MELAIYREAEDEISEYEYSEIYGYYWLLVDSIERLRGEDGFEINNLEAEFRQEHMKVKNFLFSHGKTNMDELSRKKIFPIYTTALKLNEIEKKLRNRERLSIAAFN